MSETFLHKSGAVRSADWVMYHLGAGLVVGANTCHWTKRFIPPKQEVAAARYFHIFFLIAFFEETFMRNIMIIICINYTIIICINDNAVINNYYGRLQGLVLLFKILVGSQQDFFEIHGQFGHVPSKRVTSHGLDLRSGLYKHAE